MLKSGRTKLACALCITWRQPGWLPHFSQRKIILASGAKTRKSIKFSLNTLANNLNFHFRILNTKPYVIDIKITELRYLNALCLCWCTPALFPISPLPKLYWVNTEYFCCVFCRALWAFKYTPVQNLFIIHRKYLLIHGSAVYRFHCPFYFRSRF